MKLQTSLILLVLAIVSPGQAAEPPQSPAWGPRDALLHHQPTQAMVDARLEALIGPRRTENLAKQQDEAIDGLYIELVGHRRNESDAVRIPSRSADRADGPQTR
jgi:hypothetical protein